jgi:hypothetical protein
MAKPEKAGSDGTFAPESRITFIDNPWPGGHAIEEFVFDFELLDEKLYLHLHLKTVNYFAEDPSYFDEMSDEDEDEDESDWDAKVVWGNYHRCTLSSTKWGDGGQLIGSVDAPFTFGSLTDVSFSSDPEPVDFDKEPNFGIYLLGHDRAAAHDIRIFGDVINGVFDIDWSGRIALYYAGEEDFNHRFDAKIRGVRFGGIRCDGQTESAARAMLSQVLTDTEHVEWKSFNGFNGFVAMRS